MPPDLMDMIKAGGAAMAPIFAVLWWLERSDRTALQGKLDHMTERVIVAMTETKATLLAFSNLLVAPGGKK